MKKVIVLSGLPGSGKSTIASEIAKILPNSTIIKSTKLRNLKTQQNQFDESSEEVKKEKDNAYFEMIKLAKLDIENGKIPILDATFHKKERRALLKESFPDNLLLKIHLECPTEISKQRISQRNKNNIDSFLNKTSDYEIMRSQFDSITENERFIKIKSNEISAKEAANWIIQHLS
jgi:predicted kinase